MIDRQASRLLVSFIRSFTDLQEKQLEGIHSTMRETVDGVMKDINTLSQRTQKKKDEANAVLEKTYTEPDAEVKAAIDDAQSEVDRVFDSSKILPSITSKGSTIPVSPSSKEADSSEDDLRKKLRRSTGVFSKHMESLATLDSEVQEVLFSMMGQLSRDDVISQRIEHTMMCLQAMQTSLTYLLHDFENRCHVSEVQKFAEDLRSFALRIYTMQDERKVHYALFPEDAPVKKTAI